MGCEPPVRQRAMLPNYFPPPSTVQHYFYDWRDSGLLRTMNHHLVMEARELEGQEASPSAGVIDSQSVKTTESGGVHGYDAGKNIKGRKRHIVTYTLGQLIGSLVHSADIQDRDGAPDVLKSIRHAFPWLRHIFADAAYAGPKLCGALEEIGDWTVEIIKRSEAPRALKFCPAAGSWKITSPGLDAAVDWLRTGINQSPPPGHRSSSFISHQLRGAS